MDQLVGGRNRNAADLPGPPERASAAASEKQDYAITLWWSPAKPTLCRSCLPPSM
jgi:hypothetical protein